MRESRHTYGASHPSCEQKEQEPHTATNSGAPTLWRGNYQAIAEPQPTQQEITDTVSAVVATRLGREGQYRGSHESLEEKQGHEKHPQTPATRTLPMDGLHLGLKVCAHLLAPPGTAHWLP